MIKRIGPAILLMLALCAAGCSGGPAATPRPSPSAEAPGYVTAFGTVRCTRSLTLSLPVDVRLLETYAHEGGLLPSGSPVFRIDMDQIKAERALLDEQLACSAAALETLTGQLEQARADLAKAQAAERAMDTDKLLAILKKLANAASCAKKDPYEAELLAFLVKTNSVSQYQSMVSLTADRHNVTDNARPALLKLKEQLTEARRLLEASVSALEQQMIQSQTDVLPLQRRADIMDTVSGGQTLGGVGSLRADGVFITAVPLLVSSAPRYANQSFKAGETVAAFEVPDSAVVEANVEEQLIPGVAVGARVQISPLFDRGVVWIGTVTAIADRAVIINGETVIPVTIDSEKLKLGPGYNVTVRIYPQD